MANVSQARVLPPNSQLAALLASRNNSLNDVLQTVGTGINALRGIVDIADTVGQRVKQAKTEEDARTAKQMADYNQTQVLRNGVTEDALLMTDPTALNNALRQANYDVNGSYDWNPAQAKSETPTLGEALGNALHGGKLFTDKAGMTAENKKSGLGTQNNVSFDDLLARTRQDKDPTHDWYFNAIRDRIASKDGTLDPVQQKIAERLILAANDGVTLPTVLMASGAAGYDAGAAATMKATLDYVRQQNPGLLNDASGNPLPDEQAFAVIVQHANALKQQAANPQQGTAAPPAQSTPQGNPLTQATINLPDPIEATGGVSENSAAYPLTLTQEPPTGTVPTSGSPLTGEAVKSATTAGVNRALSSGNLQTAVGAMASADKGHFGPTAPGYEAVKGTAKFKGSVSAAYDGAADIIAKTLTSDDSVRAVDSAAIKSVGNLLSLGTDVNGKPLANNIDLPANADKVATAFQTLSRLNLVDPKGNPQAEVKKFLGFREGIAHSNLVRFSDPSSPDYDKADALTTLPKTADQLYFPNMAPASPYQGSTPQAANQPTQAETPDPWQKVVGDWQTAFGNVPLPEVTKLGYKQEDFDSAMAKKMKLEALPESASDAERKALALTPQEKQTLNGVTSAGRAMFMVDKNKPITLGGLGVTVTAGQLLNVANMPDKQFNDIYNHLTGTNSTISEILADPRVTSVPQLMARLPAQQKAYFDSHKAAADIAQSILASQDRSDNTRETIRWHNMENLIQTAKVNAEHRGNTFNIASAYNQAVTNVREYEKFGQKGWKDSDEAKRLISIRDQLGAALSGQLGVAKEKLADWADTPKPTPMPGGSAAPGVTTAPPTSTPAPAAKADDQARLNAIKSNWLH